MRPTLLLHKEPIMKKTLITHVLAFLTGALALVGGVAIYDKLDNR